MARYHLFQIGLGGHPHVCELSAGHRQAQFGAHDIVVVAHAAELLHCTKVAEQAPVDARERNGALQWRTHNCAFGVLRRYRSRPRDENVAMERSPFVPCIHNIANGEAVRVFYLEELGVLDAAVFCPLDGLGLLASAARE